MGIVIDQKTEQTLEQVKADKVVLNAITQYNTVYQGTGQQPPTKTALALACAIASEIDINALLLKQVINDSGINYLKEFPNPFVREDFRRESFSTVYDANAGRLDEICYISPDVVADIVEFYSYARMGREQFALLLRLDLGYQAAFAERLRASVLESARMALVQAKELAEKIDALKAGLPTQAEKV